MSRPFRALVKHFFVQFFRVESGEEGGLSATAVLALLASPGFIMSCILFGKYSSFIRWYLGRINFDREAASQPDKYIFITLSMAVTGLVVMLRWESMFPDRRDFANLTPLPVSHAQVLLARTIALIGFMVIFLVTVNLASTLVFPGVVMEREGDTAQVMRFVIAHAVTMIVAGVWSFAAFLGLTGLMMALLPYAVFRQVKRYVQFVCVAGLVLFFLSGSAMQPAVKSIRVGQHVWAEWLPSLWMLGFYQLVQGKASGLHAELGARVIPSLIVLCVVAAVAYALTYRWFYLRSAETAEGTAAALPIPASAIKAGLLFLPRNGFSRAVLPFVLRTLTRSDSHTAVLATIAGFGTAMAVMEASVPVATEPVPLGQLTAVLLVVYALVTGLRLCFGMPAETRANWVFRVYGNDGEARPELVVRVVMGMFVAPVILGSAVATGVLYGWGAAAMHAAFCTTAAGLLILGLTSGFRVVPFTCSWMPGRENLPRTVAFWLVGAAAYSHALAAIDLFLMHDPLRLAVYIAIVTGTVWSMRSAVDEREPVVWTDTRGQLDLLRIGE